MARTTKKRSNSKLNEPYRTFSPEYWARMQAQMEICDNMQDWEIALVHEYGFDRAFAAIRENVTQAKATLALQRQRAALQIANVRNIF